RRRATPAGSRDPRSVRSAPARRPRVRVRPRTGIGPCGRDETTPWPIYTAPPMQDENTIVVLEGDQTGQELLEEGLRVLAPAVIGVELDFPRFDLSLEARRATR